MYFIVILQIIITGEPPHTASKERNSITYPSYIINKSEASIMLHCVTHYIAVYQQLFKKHLCNQNNFCYERRLSHATAKSTLFVVSKDEWNRNKDTGKSMNNALYILWYAIRYLSCQTRSNSVKFKSVALPTQWGSPSH